MCMLIPYFKNFIVIECSNFVLKLYNNKNDLLYTFPIGLGRGGIGKKSDGDQKTPLGCYQIIWKGSPYFEAEGGEPLREDSTFNKNSTEYTLLLNYPNENDIKRGYTGGGIFIHSYPTGIREHSSGGCIRVYPQDAKLLYCQVEVGSSVLIIA